MNLDQFVQKYNGVHIDEDGYYGAQCWDVSARYAREVVGCPSFPTGSGGAEGLFRIFAQPIPQYFDRIANDVNDPNQLPLPGDIIVWTAAFSPPWGHTAVCISADSGGVTVLEQNGNNPGGSSYIKRRNWTNISGWLRPKNSGDIMNTESGSELYRTGLFRDPENTGAASQWNGQTATNALRVLRTSQEWRDNEWRLKVQLPDALNKLGQKDVVINQVTAERNQLKTANDELSKRPLPSELEAEKTKVSELVKVSEIKQSEIDRLTKENESLKVQAGEEKITIEKAIKFLWESIQDTLRGFLNRNKNKV